MIDLDSKGFIPFQLNHVSLFDLHYIPSQNVNITANEGINVNGALICLHNSTLAVSNVTVRNIDVFATHVEALILSSKLFEALLANLKKSVASWNRLTIANSTFDNIRISGQNIYAGVLMADHLFVHQIVMQRIVLEVRSGQTFGTATNGFFGGGIVIASDWYDYTMFLTFI